MRPGLHDIVQMLLPPQDMKAHALKPENVYSFLWKTKGHIGAQHRACGMVIAPFSAHLMNCAGTMQTYMYMYNKTTNPMLNGCMYIIKLT